MADRGLDEQRIFHFARKLADADAKIEYLDQVCAGNTELRRRVEGLLNVVDGNGSFLKSNVEPADTTAMVEADLPAGERIGRYKLLQKIGEGGFGIVYMAEQTQPVRRNVALKIIKPGMDTKEVVARFEAERQAIAMMEHPNIAKVLDGGETKSGHPFFVMELVKGVTT